jgi:hypothetical protein
MYPLSMRFNDIGADYDIIFEGDTDTDLLYIDAGNDRVGISTSAPNVTFEVSGTTRLAPGSTKYVQADLWNAASRLLIRGAAGTGNFAVLQLESDEATDKFWGFHHRQQAAEINDLVIYEYDGAAYSDWMRFDVSATTLTVNEGGANIDFRVEGDTDVNLLHCDAGNDRVGISTGTPQVTFDVAGTTRLGDSTTNYAAFAADGELTLAGTARVKKSLDFTGAQLERGATAPTAVSVGDYTTWEYDIGDDSIIDAFEIPHDWASGTDLTVELHWQINEAYATNNGEVQWRVDWSATPDDASESIAAPTHSGQIDSGDVDIPATARYLTKTVIGTISGSDIALGDEIGMTLSRIAIDGGSDPTADPGAIHVHVVYTADKLGEAT